MAVAQFVPGIRAYELLESELKAVVCVPVTAGKGLGAGYADIDGIDLCGSVVVDDHHGCGVVFFDPHSAVSCHTVVHIGGGKACGGVQFFHHHAGAFGKIQDLQALIIAQGDGEYAVDGGHLVDGSLCVDCPEFGIFHTGAGEGHPEGKDLVGGDLIVAAQGMYNLLGDGQIAGAANLVGHTDVGHVAFCDGHIAKIRNALITGNIIKGVLFFRADHMAGSHAANVQRIAGTKGNGCSSVCELHFGFGLVAVSIYHKCRIGVVIRFGMVFQQEEERLLHIAVGISHFLGKLQAGLGLDDQLTVVAQGSAHVEIVAFLVNLVIVGVHEGNTGLGKGLGQVLGRIKDIKAALIEGVAGKIGLHIALRHIPGVVISGLGGFQNLRGDGPVYGTGSQRSAVLHIDGEAAVHVAGGTGSAGVERAVLVGIDGRILQVVVLIVLPGGIEVCVCIVGAVAGEIVVIPLVGEEIDRAVVAHMVGFRQIFAAQLLLQIEKVQMLVKSDLINQADWLFRAADGQIRQIASLIQLHIVGQSGDQSRRHGKGHDLVTVCNVLADLHGGVHHIGLGNAVGFVHLAQVAVGLDGEGRIGVRIPGRGGQHSGAFVVEAQELAFVIGIPADVVGEVIGAVVVELAVLVSQGDQSLCYIDAFDAQTGLYSGNHFPSQRGGIGGRTQQTAAGNEVAGKVRAGEQLVADQNALDIGNGHAVADPVHKGYITGQVFIFRDQGGEIAGLDLNGVHDVLKGFLQSACQVAALCLEIPIHIVFIQLSGDLGHFYGRNLEDEGPVGTLDGDLIAHISRIVLRPEIIDGSGGIGGVQHADGVGIIANTQTQGIHKGLGAVLFLDLVSGIGQGQLGSKAEARAGVTAVTEVGFAGICEVGRALGGGAVTHQHHNGLAAQQAGRGIGNRYRVAVSQELIHSALYTALDVGCAGHRFAPGSRLGGAVFIHHVRIDADRLAVSVVIGQVLTVSAGLVPAKGQHRSGIGIIKDHADPVILVGTQQSGDAFVGSVHQVLCHIVSAGVHRAADVQNQHRVRRHMGHTHHGHIGRHGGKDRQEAVGVILGNARARKGGCVGQDRLIQPYAACVFGVQRSI